MRAETYFEELGRRNLAGGGEVRVRAHVEDFTCEDGLNSAISLRSCHFLFLLRFIKATMLSITAATTMAAAK